MKGEQEEYDYLVEIPEQVLYQITAPHFTAGLLFDTRTDACIKAAPIIQWMVGKYYRRIVEYCDKKGYQIERVKENELLPLE